MNNANINKSLKYTVQIGETTNGIARGLAKIMKSSSTFKFTIVMMSIIACEIVMVPKILNGYITTFRVLAAGFLMFILPVLVSLLTFELVYGYISDHTIYKDVDVTVQFGEFEMFIDYPWRKSGDELKHIYYNEISELRADLYEDEHENNDKGYIKIITKDGKNKAFIPRRAKEVVKELERRLGLTVNIYYEG